MGGAAGWMGMVGWVGVTHGAAALTGQSRVRVRLSAQWYEDEPGKPGNLTGLQAALTSLAEAAGPGVAIGIDEGRLCVPFSPPPIA
jgi:hypothetical protein